MFGRRELQVAMFIVFVITVLVIVGTNLAQAKPLPVAPTPTLAAVQVPNSPALDPCPYRIACHDPYQGGKR